MIERHLDDWLDYSILKNDQYSPSKPEVVEILKPGFHLRPGTRLSSIDAVTFGALLLAGLPEIRAGLAWSENKLRYSHLINSNDASEDWFELGFSSWQSFTQASLNYLESDVEYVLVTDIAAYFENISIDRLIDDLIAFNVSTEVSGSLKSCLNCWAQPKKRGIPQGYSPSFILGEVYLNSIDRKLENDGLVVARYLDDLRVFCKTKSDAIQALHTLTRLLRDKELNLQTSKSRILSKLQASNEFDIAREIRTLEEDLDRDPGSIVTFTSSYDDSEVGIYVEDLGHLTARQRLEEIFSINFCKTSETEGTPRFNKSLFHYCLGRFGKLSSSYAVEICLNIILTEPQELNWILSYFGKLEEHQAYLNRLIELLTKQSVLVDHQRYMILRHVYHKEAYSSAVLAFARRCRKDRGLDAHARDYATMIIGRAGDISDLDELEGSYSSSERETSKVTIISALAGLPRSRRNAFYGRLGGETRMIAEAIKLVKESTQ